MCPVAQHTKLPPDDEEWRLIAISEACRVQERLAADQLLQPHHNLPYPAYIRLLDKYQAIRLESKQKKLALSAHRKKVRGQGAVCPTPTNP